MLLLGCANMIKNNIACYLQITALRKKQYKHLAGAFFLPGAYEKCSDKRIDSKFTAVKERLPHVFYWALDLHLSHR